MPSVLKLSPRRALIPRYVWVVLAVSLSHSVGARSAEAQVGGMGGMGAGGMRGGMGAGGMRGGRGAPPGMGRGQSPSKMMRERLQQANTLEFLLDHKKPLALSRAQQDTIKLYRDEVKRLQKPLFSTLDDVMQSARNERITRRGRGTAPNDAAGSDEGEAMGPDRFLSDTARTLLRRLEDIQQSYGNRARAQLDSAQRQRADSLQRAAFDAQRARMREQLERRRGG